MNLSRTSSARGRAAFAVAAVAIGLSALPAQAAPKTVAETVNVPLSVTLTPQGVTCDNSGSTLDLSGSMGMGGLTATMVFKNNSKGTQTTLGSSTSAVVPPVALKDIPKQPVRSGVGGNPYISVGLAVKDSAGAWVLTSPTTLIGRCVQGVALTPVTITASLPVNAAATAHSVLCDSKGSQVNLDASGVTSPIAAVVVFDNNINKVVHRSIAASDTVLSLADSSTHKGWGTTSGAGGNPLVYLRFANDTTSFTDFFLGRCKDLA